MWVQSLGWEDPLEEGMATHSSILAGESHGQRSPEGYSPRGCKESDTTEQLWLPLCLTWVSVSIICIMSFFSSSYLLRFLEAQGGEHHPPCCSESREHSKGLSHHKSPLLAMCSPPCRSQPHRTFQVHLRCHFSVNFPLILQSEGVSWRGLPPSRRCLLLRKAQGIRRGLWCSQRMCPSFAQITTSTHHYGSLHPENLDVLFKSCPHFLFPFPICSGTYFLMGAILFLQSINVFTPSLQRLHWLVLFDRTFCSDGNLYLCCPIG